MSGYTSLFGGITSSSPPPRNRESESPQNQASEEAAFPSSLGPSGDDIGEENDEFSDQEDLRDQTLHSSISPSRSNRFQNQVNKWRYLTHHERTLAASLDRLEDENLSIHLYNAHSLKRRLYRTKLTGDAAQSSNEEQPRKRRLERWHRKDRWMEKHDQQGNGAWYPHKRWTEWPLEPDAVPRPRERLAREWDGDLEQGKFTVKRQDDRQWKPSLEMEDVLLSEILRKARKRFDAREWELVEGSNSLASELSPEHRRRRGTRGFRDDANMAVNSDNDSQSSHISSRPRRRRQQNPFVNEATTKKKGTQLGSSKNDGFRSDSAWSKSGADTSADEEVRKGSNSRPVVMADDDKARALLQLPIRHTLQKLDDLLTGLHHARQSYLNPDETNSGTDTATSRESSVARNSRTRSKSRSRSVSQNRKKKPTSVSSRARRLGEIRPRDWSEVLGVAMMTGWDSEVVKRATARCSQLFGEQMEFRGLGEQSIRVSGHDRQGYTSTIAESERAVYEGVHVDGFMMPITRPSAPSKKHS